MRPLWRLIPHEAGEGLHNLTFDAWILKKRFPFPILRFYSWRYPCISHGYFQNAPTIHSNLPAHRRITGGGIVFHDQDLTYSLTYPRGSTLPWSIKRSYVDIHRVVQRSLSSLGIDVIQYRGDSGGDFCFKSPVAGDLLYRGKKIAGAAQRRKGSHLLHQGTILVDLLGVDRLQLVEAILEEFKETYQVTFETFEEQFFVRLSNAPAPTLHAQEIQRRVEFQNSVDVPRFIYSRVGGRRVVKNA